MNNMNNINLNNLGNMNPIGVTPPINPMAHISMQQVNPSNMMNPNYYQKMTMVSQPKQNFDLQNYSEEINRKKFGVSKIDELLKNGNPELAIFTFGIDLTKFGLNLNSDSEIFSTFGSPFSENPIRTDRQNIKIPECYLQPSLQLNKDLFKKFKDEILFYIFYNFKEEAVQMMAVEELYIREWRYFLRWETWIRDINQNPSNNYDCKYFSVKQWAIDNLQNLQLNIEKDICKLEQFREGLQG